MINHLRGNIPIQDTSGTLELNIARLERHIKLIEQQLVMSTAYPNHKTKLAEKKLQIQYQLQQLLQYRNTLK